MKKISILLFMPFLLLVGACEKENVSKTGFETEVKGSTNGTSLMNVPDNNGKLYLKGTISLTEGQLNLELLDPTGISLYSNTFIAPAEATIDEFYEAIKGEWTLKYSSLSGAGNINVHLSN